MDDVTICQLVCCTQEQLFWQLQSSPPTTGAVSCELPRRQARKRRLALRSSKAVKSVGSSMSAHVRATAPHVPGWRTLSRRRSASSASGRCQHVRICMHASIRFSTWNSLIRTLSHAYAACWQPLSLQVSAKELARHKTTTGDCSSSYLGALKKPLKAHLWSNKTRCIPGSGWAD